MKFLISIIIILLSFGISAFCLIIWGYVCDKNPMPNANVDIIGDWQWIALLATAAAFITVMIMINLKKNHFKSAIGGVSLIIAFATLAFSSTIGILSLKIKNDAGIIISDDIETNDNFLDEKQLDEIKYILESSSSDDITPVYISRTDCKNCMDFQHELLPVLKKYRTAIPVYYTDKDRYSEKAVELDEFIGKYNILSVPCLIIFGEKGRIIEKWDEPELHLNDLEKYL